jgi:hypothetical protein
MGEYNNLNLFIFDLKDSKSLKFKKGFGKSRSIKYRSGIDVRESKENHDIINVIQERLLLTNDIIEIDGHHIVNHDYIKTINGKDRNLIENWINVIPLTTEQHHMIPNRKMIYIKFDYDENYIYFINIYNNDDAIKINLNDFVGDKKYLKDMKSHNQEILKYLKQKELI